MTAEAPLVIVVRPATGADWEDAWPLLREMGKIDSPDRVRPRFEDLISSQDHLVVLALAGEAAVGYAWVQDRGAHLRSGWRSARLHDLFVTPAHRRRGIGRRLFLSAREWAAARRVRWLEWQASRDALGFYERLGVQGDPCPDPEHPFFEIDVGVERDRT